MVTVLGQVAVADRNMEEEGTAAFGRRAAIFIGREFDAVTRPDRVQAAREVGNASFDVLIAGAFDYDTPRSSASSGAFPCSRRA